MKKVFFACFGAIVLIVSLGSAQGGEVKPPMIEAILKADPSTGADYCPTMVKFMGTIKVMKACVVQYRFDRSDGKSEPVVVLNCPSAGTYPVKNEWKIAATSSGWETIEIISPEAVMSNKATFTLTCLPNPVIDLDLTSFPLDYNGDFTIDGKNFGASQGNKNVTFDGQPILPKPGWTLKQWTNTRIQINIRFCDIILWDHTYQVAIIEGSQGLMGPSRVISNVLAYRFMYPLYDPVCAAGAYYSIYFIGGVITVNVPNLPASSAGFTLRVSPPGQGDSLGTGKELQILTWQGAAGCTPGTISAKIPNNIDVGGHYLYLIKQGVLCSCDVDSCNCVIINSPFKKVPITPIIKK
jgi:hypothetical protein